LKISRLECRNWPNLRPDEVFNELIDRLHKELMGYNPNRGKFSTYVWSVCKLNFIDYLRKIWSPEGLTGVNGADVAITHIHEKIYSDSDGAMEREEALAGVCVEDTIHIVDLAGIAEQLLTVREYEVFCRFYLDGNSREEISKELGVSPQRVSQLRLFAEKKIAVWRESSDSAKCA
jgi:RNA polymerase sigma factor (sigma-70 family)